jgi:hypothetical protein
MGVTPKDEGTRVEPSWKTEARAWTTPLVGSIRSEHGIPKAARIVPNVLAPSGDQTII